jgi:Spy/CpxP family protein refolding chaperone
MNRFLSCLLSVTVLSLVHSLAADAQTALPNQPTRPQQSPPNPDAAPDLSTQIAELRAAIARLEASIAQRSAGRPSASGGMQGGMMGRKPGGAGAMGGMMGAGMGMGGAGAMQGGMMDDMGEMMPMASAGGMQGMDSGEMSMEMGMMGMMGMGSMGPQRDSAMSGLRASSLPGFPGASHVYHIGATGFFLDHPEHISLDTAQQQELNRLKQSALLAKASTQRKINEAEQQLWELTAADQPDADQIQAKVEETAKLRGQQRLDFIRAVGEAAKVLTDEQRQILLGLMQPGQQQAHSHPSK